MGPHLAMMYEQMTQPKVQASQVTQCWIELLVRCSDPRRTRTKMSFAGSCERGGGGIKGWPDPKTRSARPPLKSEVKSRLEKVQTHMGEEDSGDQQAWHGQAVADALHEDARAAESRARDVLADKGVDDDADDLQEDGRWKPSAAALRVDDGPAGTQTHGVGRRDDEVGGQHGPVEQPGLAHLRDDAEAWKAGKQPLSSCLPTRSRAGARLTRQECRQS